MRFSIILIALALLPMMMIAHGWLFTEKQQAPLQELALKTLRSHGIQAAVADLRYLDLRIAGNAVDLDTLESAKAAVAAISPLRIVTDDLSIPAGLSAQVNQNKLVIKGWLPDPADVKQLTQLLATLRPDLTLQTDSLHTDARVSLPDGETSPLTAESSLLRPILDKLRVSPWLEISRDEKGLHLSGILPANGIRPEILAAVNIKDSDTLLESLHTQPSSFAQSEGLVPFIKSFFGDASLRRFSINEQGPTLETAATRTQVGQWLALLRSVSEGKKVNLNLTYYPSEFHVAGRAMTTPLPAEQLVVLKETLAGHLIQFDSKSAALSSESQAQLAAMTPMLLTAGPALQLVIGGHPSPDGDEQSEKKLAKARADAVMSFLVEQGLPTSDVKTVAFDPVPPGTPAAPSQIHSAEILIR